MLLHPDTRFPADPGVRRLARELCAEVADLPLICPHGHCDPAGFARDAPFADPVVLLIQPDQYVVRVLVSQGIGYEALGIGAEGAETGPASTGGDRPGRGTCPTRAPSRARCRSCARSLAICPAIRVSATR